MSIASVELEAFVSGIPVSIGVVSIGVVSIGVHSMDEFGLQALDVVAQVCELGGPGGSHQGLLPLLPPVRSLSLLTTCSPAGQKKKKPTRRKEEEEKLNRKQRRSRRRRRRKIRRRTKGGGEVEEVECFCFSLRLIICATHVMQ